ncbi:hypothetical protein OROGR_009143 [Orobanche gracilis]
MASTSSSASKLIGSELLTVSYNTELSTKKYYENFIEQCLILLSSYTHLSIPVLPSKPSSVTNLTNYFFIKLQNGIHEIILVARKDDLYLIGTKCSVIIWYFRDITTDVVESIFPKNKNKNFSYIKINFEASYVYLEAKAKMETGRGEYVLGIDRFSSFISILYKLKRDDRRRDEHISKAFIIFIQLISEAIRLKKFSKKILDIVERQDGIFLTILPDPYDMSCQNNWGTMSNRCFEKSNRTDLFDLPIHLDEDNEGVECILLDNVDKVRDVVQIIKSPLKG